MKEKNVTKQLVDKALELNKDNLIEFENVVGLAVCHLIEGQPKSGYAISVYVRKKLPLEALSQEQVIPPFLEINSSGSSKKIPTKVIEVGEITLG